MSTWKKQKEEKSKWCEEILFECDCGSLDHLMHFYYDKYDGDIMDGLNVFMNYRHKSFWELLKIWWKKRDYWFSECIITKEDVKELIIHLNKYLKDLEKYEQESKTSK